MEVEKLVGKLRALLDEVQMLKNDAAPDIELPDEVYKGIEDTEHCSIQLDRHRAIATAAKIIADDPTLPDDLAGALLQMYGAGGAKPYEVTNE